MLQKNDISNSFLEAFHKMQENVEYELLPEAFTSLNEYRKNIGQSELHPFSFQRTENRLIFNWMSNGCYNNRLMYLR